MKISLSTFYDAATVAAWNNMPAAAQEIDELQDTWPKPESAVPLKYYLAAENDRNTRHGLLYQRFFRLAFQNEREIVLVGHHFVCAPSTGNEADDLQHVNELPSADTALFDHTIMQRVFGPTYLEVIAALAGVPTEQREELLEARLNAL